MLSYCDIFYTWYYLFTILLYHKIQHHCKQRLDYWYAGYPRFGVRKLAPARTPS